MLPSSALAEQCKGVTHKIVSTVFRPQSSRVTERMLYCMYVLPYEGEIDIRVK